jgi:hypothetical protein
VCDGVLWQLDTHDRQLHGMHAGLVLTLSACGWLLTYPVGLCSGCPALLSPSTPAALMSLHARVSVKLATCQRAG